MHRTFFVICSFVIILSSLLSQVLPECAVADTTVSSNISADTIWTVAGSPYIVTAYVSVEAGVTLTVEPGVVVQFQYANGMSVQGTINALGSSMSPITWTGSSTNPGHWKGIYVLGNGSINFDYCNVSYGGYYHSSTVGYVSIAKTGTGSLSITNSTINYSSVDGLRIFSNSGPLSTTNTNFSNNGRGVAIGLNMSSDFISDDCVFTNNTHDVRLESGIMTADATWDLNPSYSIYLSGLLSVEVGAVLTVAEGTVIKVDPGDGIHVAGSLQSQGTSGTPVYFTDYRDDTVGGDSNNDDPEVAPARGSWQGIYVYDTGSATFDYTTVSYGGYYYNSTFGNVSLAKTGSGTLAFNNSTISYGSSNGLRIFANSGTLSASGSTFSNNSSGVAIGLNMSSDFLADDCVFTDNTHDVRLEPGIMTADATWDLNPNYSIYMDGHITVGVGTVLTVAPGTIIKAESGSGMYVAGSLLSQGTSGAPVHFTDWRNDAVGSDSNNDGGTTTAAGGWWQGIYIYGAGTATLDYTTVSYGGYYHSSTVGYVNMAKAGTGSLTLNNSTVSYGNHNGLRIFANSGTLSASGSTFSNNSSGVAIGIDMSSDFLADDCVFTDNSHDVRLESGTMTAHATWDLNPNYSIYMDGNITVGVGTVLSVAPGTIIKAAQSSGMYVAGTLLSQGTSGAPVYFTDWRNDAVGSDSNNDGGGTTAAGGWWKGIYIYDAGTATLDYTTVSYGGYYHSTLVGYVNMAKTGTGSLTLNNSTVSHGNHNGLRIFANSGALLASGSTFSNNSSGVAIGIDMSSDFIADDCVFTDNSHDVRLEPGTMTANATWDLNTNYSIYMDGNITVDVGTVLSVTPGTIVKAGHSSGIYVAGTLLSQGTSGAPVYFTDWRNDAVGSDSNNDGGTTTAAGGWWKGIYIYDAGSATFDYSTVSYGGYYHSSAVGYVNLAKTGTGSLTLNNSTVSHGNHNGLRVFANIGALSASRCTFANNHTGVSIGIGMSTDFIDSACVFNNNSYDVSLEPGTITSNTTWALNSAYSLYSSGTITVGSGANLTVAPGTVLKIAFGYGIDVQGTILAKGTNGSPIYFTSWEDDTVGGDSNNDDPENPPGPGWWKGIYVNTAGSATMEYCHLRYGGYYHSSTVRYVNFAKTGSGDLSLRYTTFSNCNDVGLYVFSSTGTHTIRNSSFLNNGIGLRFVSPPAGISLSSCIFESNSSYGLLNDGPLAVDATGNWWGDSSGPYHAALNSGGLGDTVSDNVLFDPWRSTSSFSMIKAPIREGTIVAGDSLRFSGTPGELASQSYLWDFDDGRESTLLTPGVIGFHSVGTFDVSFALVDSGGTVDDNPELRSLTVVADSGSVPDLDIVTLNVPSSLSVGQTATVGYSVKNIGTGAVSASSWVDVLYLSEDPYLDSGDQILATAGKAETLAIGGSYNAAFQVHVPATTLGSAYLIVSVDDKWAVLEQHQLNNETAASTSIGVQSLASNVPTSGSLIDANPHYYRVDVSEGNNFVLSFSGNVTVYLRYGALSTFALYDYRQHFEDGGEIVIPGASPGEWYVMIVPASGESTVPYDITPKIGQLLLSGVTPDYLASTSPMVLTVTGTGFVSGTTISLVSSGGMVYPANESVVDSYSQITATFAANSVPAGIYDLRVTHLAQTDELSNGFEVLAGGEAILETSMTTPGVVGYHQLATIYVNYSNTGNAAMVAPLLIVTATQNGERKALLTLDQSRLVQGYWTSAIPEGFSNSVVILASGATEGVLQPGESVQVPVYYAGWLKPWDFSYPTINFTIGSIKADDVNLYPWDRVKSTSRPASLETAAFEAIWSNFKTEVGSTWGDYITMLAGNASYLGRLGQRVLDVDELYTYEMMQADTPNPYKVLSTTVDASVPAPGMPVSFARYFHDGISARYKNGALGRGWSHAWEKLLEVQSDGTVSIQSMNKSRRTFKPDSRGGYFSAPGDYGTLTSLGGGAFLVRENNGTVTAFRTDGKLDYAGDTNNNRITCSYSGDLLTGLTHSSGQTLTIEYNGSNHIDRIVDQQNRAATFSYDGGNEYLMSVLYYDGRFIQYDYSSGGAGATEHALAEVTFPDGTHSYFSYGSNGRLATLQNNGVNETLTYSYGSAGEVSNSNSDGSSITDYFDNRARLAKMIDSLGNTSSIFYDALGNMSRVSDPLGRSSSFTYDNKGNMLSYTDALGNRTLYSYGGPFERPTTVTDVNGSISEFSYDSKGNLLQLTEADGSSTQYSYDSFGNNTTRTNARGQSISYTYNSHGLVTSKVYPGPVQVDYEYDVRGNLISTTDLVGTTTYQYNGNDQLESIAFTGSRTLTFTYDSAGRRASSIDQLGHTLNYLYNSLGRIQSLTDGLGMTIVSYTYNDSGLISRKDLNSGVYTTYLYDTVGQMLSLKNYNSSAVLLSNYDYTYDSVGLRTTMATQDGTWTYGYDSIGRLLSAQFSSINVDIADQSLSYSYDGMGNRTQVVDNGLTTSYTTNNMNQYTQVGDVAYTYDSDGNLIQETSSAGTTTYGYDEENSMISISSSQGNWQYGYDAMKNCVATTKDGLTTHAVIDPVGRGNLVAEYNVSGDLIANYDYGHRLLTRTDSGGNTAYYNFDALGSTSELTSAAGTILNSYSYRPFGDLLTVHQTSTNPFQFIGESGVSTEDNGLHLMRARFYQPQLGRFLSRDPIAVEGQNPYTYAMANPISNIDPGGRASEYDDEFLPPELAAYNNWRKRFRDGSAQKVVSGLAESCWKGWVFTALSAGGTYVMFTWELPPLAIVGGAAVTLYTAYWTWNDTKSTGDTLHAEIQIRKRILRAAQRVREDALRTGHKGLDPNIIIPDDVEGLSHEERIRILIEALNTIAVIRNEPLISKDPNQKLGPGVGAGGWVAADTLLPYRIDFENNPDALAPAQVVSITDQLSTNLDWDSFQLTEVGFGDHLLAIPAHTNDYDHTERMTYNGKELDVRIQVNIDLTSGLISAMFSTTDVATGLPPEVSYGFLPPEDDTGRGQGHISYIINPKAGLSGGTEIRNIATINFDFSYDITTNQVDPYDASQGTDPNKEALVSIDTDLPMSTMTALPPISNSDFSVQWSGLDGSSGIETYSIYVRDDNSNTWNLWLQTVSTSAMYSGGVPGRTYEFYSVATDKVGHLEQKSAQVEASTTVAVPDPETPFPWLMFLPAMITK